MGRKFRAAVAQNATRKGLETAPSCVLDLNIYHSAISPLQSVYSGFSFRNANLISRKKQFRSAKNQEVEHEKVSQEVKLKHSWQIAR